MLTAIRQVKGCGVFRDFKAGADLPPLRRLNIVYGENGSGKTTLSRLLSCLHLGSHAEYPDLDFELSTQAGALKKGQGYHRKVRVFNSDYVAANIGPFDRSIPHILIVGEQNKALAEELKREQALLALREQAITSAEQAVAKSKQERDKALSSIAKTIGEATSGSSLRQYRRPDAEAAFGKLGNPQVLSDQALDTHRATVRQELAEPVPVPALRDASGSPIAAAALAARAATLVNGLMPRTSQSAAIQRLSEQPAIAKWAEQGLEIHRSHGSTQCEFCAQPLPKERMAALAEHFGAEDQRFKAEIEAAIAEVTSAQQLLTAQSFPSKTALYGELRADYEKPVAALDAARQELAADLGRLIDALHSKLSSRSAPCDKETPPGGGAKFDQAFAAACAVLERHNAKSAAFEQEKTKARNAIERHYLSTIHAAITQTDASISARNAEVRRLTDGDAQQEDKRSLEALKQSIAQKQAKVSSAHAGGAELTDHLKKFLGRTDLTFESGKEGYRVMRRGKPARGLSEGEKTAIAFIYFLVHLKDQDFDLAEGVVVIDDPISSLDASAMYQAFAFLKNGVLGAKQVFILTHNFDFLKLLLNWSKAFKQADKTFLMLLCAEADQARSARIVPLDPLLVAHPTEYQYLFKVLYTFKSDGTILSSYHIPNIARKVLETFLEFHIPSGDSLYTRLEAIDFDAHKKTAIYKFSNDLSHPTGKGFDPALVAETQKNTTYLLEMIKAVAPKHFEGLETLAKAA